MPLRPARRSTASQGERRRVRGILAAGLVASVVATSLAVLTFSPAAQATSPDCYASADNPYASGGHVNGEGWIFCSQTAKFTLTTKLWRYDGNGVYTGFSTGPYNGVDTYTGIGEVTTCVGGASRIWHTESIISWKIYSGANLVASGSGYDNSGTVSLPCH